MANDRARIRSLFIVHFSMLILSLGTSIIFTGVWPYLKMLDPSVTLDQYGLVVASDAFAQMLFSPLFGIIADRMGRIRVVSMVCAATFCTGSAFYSLISLIPQDVDGLHKPRVWATLAARFIVGIGTAIHAASRAYISKVTTTEERTTHVALYSLFQTVGFILGPAIQAALTPVGTKPFDEGSDFVVNMYTATGWVSTFNGILLLIMFMPGIFVEFDKAPEPKKPKPKQAVATVATATAVATAAPSAGPEPGALVNRRLAQLKQKPKELTKQYSRISVMDGSAFLEDEEEKKKLAAAGGKTQYPDLFATITSMWGFFSFFLSFVTIEVLVTPMAIDQWGWTQQETIMYLGIVMAAGGALAAFCFSSIGPLSKRIDERLLLLFVGIVPLMIGRSLMMPMGSEHPPIAIQANITDRCGWEPPADQPNTTWSDHFEPGFCNYCWCLELPRMTVVQFMIGFVFSTASYPFCVAIMASRFSKVLGPIPQGFWMGLLTTFGSVARVTGPLLLTQIYEKFGTYATFGLIVSALSVTFVLVCVFYHRLVSPQDLKKNQNRPKPIEDGTQPSVPVSQDAT